MMDIAVLRRIDPVDEWALDVAVTHPSFEELFEEIVAEVPRHRQPRPRRARRRWLALCAAVVAAAVALSLWAAGEFDGLRPFRTPWRAAAPMVESGARHTRSGSWQLVDAALTGTWHQHVAGPPPGRLTCATPGRCYVMAGRYPSAVAGAQLLSESLYVTTDAGDSWSVLPMPAVDPSTALACAGATWCAAGASYGGHAVLVTTADGGHSFRVVPLPGGAGSLYGLTCPAAGSCEGLAAGATGSTTSPVDATWLTTSDGGTTWTDRPLPPGDSMVALSCTSVTACTVIGYTDATATRLAPDGVSAVTADGGRTWAVGTLPAGFGVRGPSRVTCPAAGTCVMTGVVPIAEHCRGAVTPTPVAAIPMAPAVRAISESETELETRAQAQLAQEFGTSSCTDSGETLTGDVAVSTDGGLHWTPRAMPDDVPRPQLSGLSCPTATECWATGAEDVAERIGAAIDDSSPVVLGTADGGTTWSKVTFSVPATAPNATGQSFLTVASVSCASAGVCLAEGNGAQGAPTVPDYSLVVTGS